MRKNRSPWLHQLDATRAHQTLEEDRIVDIAIVGAGIAGMATAFHILETTEKSVLVLEKWKLAHGATGHNAGQVFGHFERGLKSLVDEYGLKPAIHAQASIESAWETLQHMYDKAELDIPFYSFTGSAGFTSRAQVLLRLKNCHMRALGNLSPEPLFLLENPGFEWKIPKKYAGLYTFVAQSELQKLLETERTDFVGVLSYKKGVINSALFCQELLRYFLKEYPDRFSLYEHTPAHKIVLHESKVLIDTEKNVITASRVVLCTNGFENVRIFNTTGLDIDAKYHYLVTGKQGYMSGYLETNNKPPAAISYFTDPSTAADNSYYYLTRRPYEYEKGTTHNLISVGGPDVTLEDTTPYSRDDEYPEKYAEEIDQFIKSTYDLDPNKKIEYEFTWHGLMGYTKNGVRMIGPEPRNPLLLYNLGCNGIGILPSLYGATKIARHIRGEIVESTIFDIPKSLEAAQANTEIAPLARFFRWLRS